MPHDVSVVGFDDVPLGGHQRIQLTTVRAHGVPMGRRACDCVIAAARDGRDVAIREAANASIVLRGSTAAPRP